MLHPFPTPARRIVAPESLARPLPPHLAQLREKLRYAAAPGKTLPLHPAIDHHLPANAEGTRGLPLAALHEIAGQATDIQDAALPAAFAARLATRLPGTGAILWLSPADDLYPLGLAATLDPGRVVLAAPRTDADTLGAAETALREGGFCAVVLEAGRVDRTASRRLTLACQRHGATALLIRRFPHGRAAPDREALAVATRWHLAPAPSAMTAPREPGPARLIATLTHARGGRPGAWLLESEPRDATYPLGVVAPLAADPAAETPRRVA